MAVLKMQRLGICAWKKNRKQILELLQRRGVLDIDTDAVEDEVFQKTDTSEARGSFERDIQLAEHALEILQQYVPEQKGLLSSLEGRKEVDLESCRRMEAARDSVLEKARRLEELLKGVSDCESEMGKLENEKEALEPWKTLEVPMDFPGTKRTKALIGTFPGTVSTDQLCEMIETRLPELEYDTRWRFAASGRERSELTRAILGEAEGVARVWEVSVDGEAIGLAADRSALGEVLMAAIAEAAPPDSLRAGFSSEIALRELYVPEGAATDLMELSAMIRSLVRVTWVSSSL